VTGGTVTTNEPRYRSTGVNAGLTLDDVVNAVRFMPLTWPDFDRVLDAGAGDLMT
jgi:hypothetical protein